MVGSLLKFNSVACLNNFTRVGMNTF